MGSAPHALGRSSARSALRAEVNLFTGSYSICMALLPQAVKASPYLPDT